MTTIIQTKSLTKYYGKHLALENLNLEVGQGEIFGFLGPNGAGKTTFIKMMLGFIRPTEGTLSLFGQKPHEYDRSRIGYLPEKIVIQPFLSGREFLRYQGNLIGLAGKMLEDQIDHAVERLEMSDAADRRISDYSKGMVQRIGVANLLLGDKNLLMLDEPNSGLDPMGIALIRKLMISLRDEGKTIFFNSHQLLEVEKTCDRVAILNMGKIVASGSSRELSSKRGIRLEVEEMTSSLVELLKQNDSAVIIQGNCAELNMNDTQKERMLPAQIVNSGGRILSYIHSIESLEDVFQRLIKN